jgi:hypothetical protein
VLSFQWRWLPLFFFLFLTSGIAQVAPPQPGQLRQADDSGRLRDTMTAPPLSVAGKFEQRVMQTLGARGLLGAAIGSSFAQGLDTPGEWGGGVEGYSKRFASSFGTSLSRQAMAFTLESVLREDPRYFPSTERSKKARLMNVLKQTVFTRTDSGKPTFAYANVISAFGAGQFANLWQPNSTSSVGDGIERGFLMLGAGAAQNLLEEFIPRFRPRELRPRP